MHTLFYTQAFARKWKLLAAGAVLSVALSSTGCSSMNNTESGALGGAGIGALFGTLFGLAVHHPVAGAAIGAAAGGVIGGAEGASVDRAERREAVREAAIAADQQRKALTLTDIAQLTASGTSDAIIITQIRTSGAVYSLTAADIQYLQQNRVSDAVITEMQATATRPVVYQRPVERVYVTDPYGPPVVGVRVYGGGYRRW